LVDLAYFGAMKIFIFETESYLSQTYHKSLKDYSKDNNIITKGVQRAFSEEHTHLNAVKIYFIKL